MKKINEIMAVEYMKVFFPTVRQEIINLSAHNNFPGAIQVTVDYLKELTQNSKIQNVDTSIKRMFWIYKNGNSYIRYIIENLYVRSFGSLRKHLEPQQWRFLYQEIPKDFIKIYCSQNDTDYNLKN